MLQPGTDILMNQHQVNNPDFVLRELGGKGAEAQIGHLDDPVEVISRVRHGQKQYLHFSTLGFLSLVYSWKPPAIIRDFHYKGPAIINNRC